MSKRESFQQALGRLRNRFPSAFGGIESIPIHDWDGDERGLIHLFEEFIGRCKWDTLDNFYAARVNELFKREQGENAGVGMVNANLELRCRALIWALNDLS